MPTMIELDIGVADELAEKQTIKKKTKATIHLASYNVTIHRESKKWLYFFE